MPTKITTTNISQYEGAAVIVASSPKISSGGGTSSSIVLPAAAIEPCSSTPAMPMTMTIPTPAVTTTVNKNIAAHYLKIDIETFRQIDLRKKSSLDDLIPPLVPSRGGSLKPPPTITGYSKNFRQVLAQIHQFRCLSQGYQKVEKERWSRLQKWEQNICFDNIAYLMNNKKLLLQIALKNLKLGGTGSDRVAAIDTVTGAGAGAGAGTPRNNNVNSNSNTNGVDASACSIAKSISSTDSSSAASITSSSGSDTHSVSKKITLAKAQGTNIGENMFSLISSHSATTNAAAAAPTSNKKRKRNSGGREPMLSKSIFHKLATSITARAKLQDVMTGYKGKHVHTNDNKDGNDIGNGNEDTRARTANASIGIENGCTRQPPSLTLTTISIRRREWASNRNSSQGQGQAPSSSSSSALLSRPEMIVAGSTKERVISDMIQFLAKMGPNNATATAIGNANENGDANVSEEQLNEKEKGNIEEMVSLEDVVLSFQFLFGMLVGSAGGEFLEGLLGNMWRDHHCHCDASKHGRDHGHGHGREHGYHKKNGDRDVGGNEHGNGTGVQGFLAREGVLPKDDALSNVCGICNIDVADSEKGNENGHGNGIQWLLDDKGSLVHVVRDWSEGVAERTFPSSISASASASVSCRQVHKNSGGAIDLSESDAERGGEENKRPVLLDLTNEEEG